MFYVHREVCYCSRNCCFLQGERTVTMHFFNKCFTSIKIISDNFDKSEYLSYLYIYQRYKFKNCDEIIAAYDIIQVIILP